MQVRPVDLGDIVPRRGGGRAGGLLRGLGGQAGLPLQGRHPVVLRGQGDILRSLQTMYNLRTVILIFTVMIAEKIT